MERVNLIKAPKEISLVCPKIRKAIHVFSKTKPRTITTGVIIVETTLEITTFQGGIGKHL